MNRVHRVHDFNIKRRRCFQSGFLRNLIEGMINSSVSAYQYNIIQSVSGDRIKTLMNNTVKSITHTYCTIL